MAQAPTEAQKAQLLKQLQCAVKQGTVLFKEGENSRELYILLKGKLEIPPTDRNTGTQWVTTPMEIHHPC